jgi:hypothetical protein
VPNAAACVGTSELRIVDRRLHPKRGKTIEIVFDAADIEERRTMTAESNVSRPEWDFRARSTTKALRRSPRRQP